MAVIHFLNVKEGDCSVIQHYSGHITVVDVCNARPVSSLEAWADQTLKTAAKADMGIRGNFNQKHYPVNPVIYLKEHGIESIFRFILTHPDMDHLDGIKSFFGQFAPINFWDVDNQVKKEFEEGSPYNEEDWEFYENLRDTSPDTNPKRLTLLSGENGKYWNIGGDGSGGGDGFTILAPTSTLVNEAHECDEYNDCSYVLLYQTDDHRIVFGGDSHDKTWDHILSNHAESVRDIDLLIAPHHGRKSGRSYAFLDVLRPKMTLFGNARSQHLAYDAWSYRNLKFITNNQAGCMVVNGKDMSLYVTHEPFAKAVNPYAFYSTEFQAYWVCQIA
jgi:beta-lactamase superfamily II metal-dependent hydrolase